MAEPVPKIMDGSLYRHYMIPVTMNLNIMAALQPANSSDTQNFTSSELNRNNTKGVTVSAITAILRTKFCRHALKFYIKSNLIF
jgi:hypothetical protein